MKPWLQPPTYQLVSNQLLHTILSLKAFLCYTSRFSSEIVEVTQGVEVNMNCYRNLIQQPTYHERFELNLPYIQPTEAVYIQNPNLTELKVGFTARQL